MYSPNGTGCCLTYVAPGPVRRVPDDARVADLVARALERPRRRAPARRRRAPPRRSGRRPAGRCTGRGRWRSPARRPGPGAAPARRATSAASRAGRLDVVAQHRRALGERVQPEPRDVALHERHPDRVARRSAAGTSSGHQRDEQRGGAGDERGAGGRGRVSSSGEQAAEQGDRGGDQRRAAERGQRQSAGCRPWLNASRPHGKPPNGRRSRSASWATHSAGPPQRPGRQPRDDGERRAERGEEGGLRAAPGRARAPGPATAPVQCSSGTNSPSPQAGPPGRRCGPGRRAPRGRARRPRAAAAGHRRRAAGTRPRAARPGGQARGGAQRGAAAGRGAGCRGSRSARAGPWSPRQSACRGPCADRPAALRTGATAWCRRRAVV